MKKILLLLSLVAFVCLLASCSHKHEASEKYGSDENNHWNLCANQKCTEMLNITPHTWGEGEITTSPTSTQDGVMSYLCTTCKRLKQEPVKYEANKSISKEQWEKSFLEGNFANATLKVEEITLSGDYKTTVDIQVNNDIVYMVASTLQAGKEIGYVARYQAGGVEVSVSSREQKWEDGKYELIGEKKISIVGILKNSGLLISNSYDRFTFNEQTGYYETNNLTVEDKPFGFEKLEIKFADGKISEIKARATDGMETKITISNYGKTAPKNPLEKTENK